MDFRKGIFFGIFFSVFLISLVLAIPPTIEFTDPTPNSTIFGVYEVNVSSQSSGSSHYTLLSKDSDLELWYRFENSSIGDDFGEYDWSGKGRHGNISAQVEGIYQGVFNRSIKFNGVASAPRGEIIVPTSLSSVDFGSGTNSHFAYALWLNFSGGSPSAEFVFDFNRADGDGISLKELAGGIRIDYGNGTDVIAESLGIGSRESVVNQWNHYVITYNGSDILVYYNGNLQFNKNEPNIDPSIDGGLGGNRIGCRGVSTYYCLNGSIDEFIVFSRNLNSSEVKALYNASANQYFQSFSASGSGDTIQAYAVNLEGEISTTGQRDLNATSISIDWPSSMQTFQRDNLTDGEITLRGRAIGSSGNFSYSYVGTYDSTINREITLVAEDESPETFDFNISLPVGAYNLTIYDSEDNSINTSVNNIRVGDVFFITGQSNALGLSLYSFSFNESNTYPVYQWNGASWVSPTLTRYWVPVFDNLTRSNNVPIAFWNGGLGGVTLGTWVPNGTNWNATIANHTLMFNGSSKKMATILMFQGESDVGAAESSTKANFINYANSSAEYWDMYTEGVVMGQINRRIDDADANLLIRVRRPQQQLWSEQSFVYSGPISYDIQMSQDSLHFRTQNESLAIANRWIPCIQRAVYGGSGCTETNISSIQFVELNVMRVVFNNEVYSSYWNGSSGERVYGFRFVNGSIYRNDSSGIDSVLKVNDNTVEINFSEDIGGGWNLSYGRELDGYNKVVLRDSEGRPVQIIYDYLVDDSVNPEVTINYPLQDYYNSSYFEINVSLNEYGKVQYSLDGGNTNYTMTSLGEFEFNSTNSSIADGNYILNIYANDTLGNKNHTSSVNFTVDTVFPEVNLSRESSSGTSITTDFSSSSSCTDSGTGVEECILSSSVGSINENVVSGLSCGNSYDFIVTARDYAGNIKEGSFSMATSSCSSGGGSNGAGSSFWTNTYRDENHEFASGSLIRQLKEKQRSVFKVEGSSHHLGVLKIDSTNLKVLIEIASDNPVEVWLLENETKLFELTGDNYYDLSVFVKNIENGFSELEIKQIYQIIEEDFDSDIQRENSASQKRFDIDEQGSKYLFFVMIFAFIVLAILVFFIRRIISKKRKFRV